MSFQEIFFSNKNHYFKLAFRILSHIINAKFDLILADYYRIMNHNHNLYNEIKFFETTGLNNKEKIEPDVLKMDFLTPEILAATKQLFILCTGKTPPNFRENNSSTEQ